MDDRNQFDWVQSLPYGGVSHLREAVHELEQRFGIKVMLPYNPWDTGTRRLNNNRSDAEELARFLNLSDTVGIFGDTMYGMGQDIYTTAFNVLNRSIALQPENLVPLSTVNWTVMGWGYWNYPTQPCIDTIVFVQQGHLTSVCNRWAKDKTDDVQSAFINGVGYVPWENIWGTWNGITPRDGELIRRAATLLRFFGSAALARKQFGFQWPQERVPLRDGRWMPLIPLVTGAAVSQLYSSKWSLNVGNDTAIDVFFIVNRGNADYVGEVLRRSDYNSSGSIRLLIDCYHGRVLSNTSQGVILSITKGSMGCVFMCPTTMEPLLVSFLDTMSRMTQTPLTNYSDVWTYLPQRMINRSRTSANILMKQNFSLLPVSGVEVYTFNTTGLEVEGPDDYGVDFQMPWESYPRRTHLHNVSIAPFVMMRWPVTKGQYDQYLQETKYTPNDCHNFLKDWNHSSSSQWQPIHGTEDQPVTWVSYEESARFCEHYGMRLPDSWEWQWAGQAVGRTGSGQDRQWAGQAVGRTGS
eukprot:PhF_6_TR935/c0_g1_i2/m.1668